MLDQTSYLRQSVFFRQGGGKGGPNPQEDHQLKNHWSGMHAVCEGVSAEGPFTLEEGQVQCTFAPGGAEDCCETCEVCTNGELVAASEAPTCTPATPGDACDTPPGTQPLHAEFWCAVMG